MLTLKTDTKFRGRQGYAIPTTEFTVGLEQYTGVRKVIKGVRDQSLNMTECSQNK